MLASCAAFASRALHPGYDLSWPLLAKVLGDSSSLSLGEVLAALVFAHSAPHTVGLAYRKCVFAAFIQDWARGANCLGRFVAASPGATSFALRVEKQIRVRIAA